MYLDEIFEFIKKVFAHVIHELSNLWTMYREAYRTESGKPNPPSIKRWLNVEESTLLISHHINRKSNNTSIQYAAT